MRIPGVALLRAFAHGKMQGWLAKRMPAVPELQLNHKNIFIFPSGAGWLFLLIGGLILIGGANYQNNVALALAFWLGSLAMVGVFISFRNVMGLRLRAKDAMPVFVGEPARFPVWLDDPDGRAHQLLAIGLSRADLREFDLDAQAQTMQELSVETERRGLMTMPRFLLQSVAPFGWMRVWTWPFLAAQCVVYPAPIKPPFAFEQLGGSDGKKVFQQEGADDFFGHRRWRSGDPLRQVDWKIYAKERGLMVREFATPATDEWWFRLQDLPAAGLDIQLGWLSHMLLSAEHQGQRYGLDLGSEKFAPNQGDLHLHRCLKALALFRQVPA